MIADANWLARTHAACFSDSRPWSADEFRTLIGSERVTIVARPQGFAMARTAADEAEILTIAVLPVNRQRGFGRQLLDELEKHLAAQEVRYLFLEVSEANTPALALYYSCKFSESGRRSAYYADSTGAAQDALVLSKPLEGPPGAGSAPDAGPIGQ